MVTAALARLAHSKPSNAAETTARRPARFHDVERLMFSTFFETCASMGLLEYAVGVTKVNETACKDVTRLTCPPEKVLVVHSMRGYTPDRISRRGGSRGSCSLQRRDQW